MTQPQRKHQPAQTFLWSGSLEESRCVWSPQRQQHFMSNMLANRTNEIRIQDKHSYVIAHLIAKSYKYSPYIFSISAYISLIYMSTYILSVGDFNF